MQKVVNMIVKLILDSWFRAQASVMIGGLSIMLLDKYFGLDLELHLTRDNYLNI